MSDAPRRFRMIVWGSINIERSKLDPMMCTVVSPWYLGVTQGTLCGVRKVGPWWDSPWCHSLCTVRADVRIHPPPSPSSVKQKKKLHRGWTFLYNYHDTGIVLVFSVIKMLFFESLKIRARRHEYIRLSIDSFRWVERIGVIKYVTSCIGRVSDWLFQKRRYFFLTELIILFFFLIQNSSENAWLEHTSYSSLIEYRFLPMVSRAKRRLPRGAGFVFLWWGSRTSTTPCRQTPQRFSEGFDRRLLGIFRLPVVWEIERVGGRLTHPKRPDRHKKSIFIRRIQKRSVLITIFRMGDFLSDVILLNFRNFLKCGKLLRQKNASFITRKTHKAVVTSISAAAHVAKRRGKRKAREASFVFNFRKYMASYRVIKIWVFY